MATKDGGAVTGTLTSCPNIWGDLKVEPQLPPEALHAVAGLVVKNNASSAASIVGRNLPWEQFARRGAPVRFAPGAFTPPIGIVPNIGSMLNLGWNTPQFYSAIGVAVAVQAQVVQQVAAQAKEINKEYPSLWYVNFPKQMSSHDADMVRQYRQSMLDFRSWSSMKWWQEVSRRFGNPGDMIQRVQQSKEFAKIACEDMVKMSWLRTTKAPYEARHQIDCMAGELHQNLISRALTGWSDVDRDTFDAIEPLLQDIVRSAQPGITDFNELKVVIAEKYVYDSATDSIVSYIRLICFELREAFYNVIMGKNRSQTRVNVQLSLLQYEAVFEVGLWNQYSDSINANDKDMFQDFIKRQTIDM